MKLKHSLFLLLLSFMVIHTGIAQPVSHHLSLNGEWQSGVKRNYEKQVNVPGIVTDPGQMNEHTLWYRKRIQLPGGDWHSAILHLKGARFNPEVYVNGEQVSAKKGGMAPTHHPLDHKKVQPGNEIVLEIALASLKDVSKSNASRIPEADHHRSNIASCLWDDVILHTYKKANLSRMIPFTKTNKVKVYCEVDPVNDQPDNGSYTVKGMLKQPDGDLISENTADIEGQAGNVSIPFEGQIKKWRPEQPHWYFMDLILKKDGRILDSVRTRYGAKNFDTEGLHFTLNGREYPVRAGTVVWHRWVREEYAHDLAWDSAWFRKHVVQRLKSHGANCLRFHLGTPPERLLDLCDKYGLLVQYEWSFFHGMPASKESLLKQWQNWLDLAMKHPSVSLIHPYNETKSERLDIAWAALDSLLKDYPPLVLEERDVTHLHEYWWSLFENLGLYYDTVTQFDQPIMVDEFGGNYLDGNWELGGYPTLKESFMRFLGRNHTKQMRAYHHTISNSKIAEYWRRIGAAGFSPFPVFGSWEDGNHWFLGEVKEGKPKPVWNALTAAWSPVSVSPEVWDRNYTSGQTKRLPVYLFNDTRENRKIYAEILITEKGNPDHAIRKKRIIERVQPLDEKIQYVSLSIPQEEGEYTFRGILENRPDQVKHPVESKWDFRVFNPALPGNVKDITVGLPEKEPELRDFANKWGFTIGEVTNRKVDVVLTSIHTWHRIRKGNKAILKRLERAIDNGVPVVMLDVGARYLGEDYPEKEHDQITVRDIQQIKSTKNYPFFKGLDLSFNTVAEAESHIHPSRKDSSLWSQLKDHYTWLWNGLRGGVIVPAVNMELSGLNRDAFVSVWETRGAEASKIRSDAYYAYELQGHYAFSSQKNDTTTRNKLREDVKSLVRNAPALANSIDPSAPIQTHNLTEGYHHSQNAEANDVIPLVNAGKSLTKTPVYEIQFGEDQGDLILSQLLTHKRLVKSYSEEGLYGIKYDPVAVQMVFNMMSKVMN